MSITSQLRRFAATAAVTLVLGAGAVVATATPAAAASNTALPPVGSTICHLAPVSGLRCGTLVAVNLTVTFPGGTVTGLFRYTACSMPGDQNAPIFRPDTGAQIGTIFAGSGTCTSGGHTYGMPLR